MAGRWIDEWRAEGSRNGPEPERGRWDGAEERSFGRPGFRDLDAESPHDGRPAWQDRDYEGVSPAFRHHEDPYERGYSAYPRRDGGGASGVGGRYGYDRGQGSDDHDSFENRARQAGAYFRRTGRKISTWLNEASSEGLDAANQLSRTARGLGPKGYKRSDERISEDVHHHLTDDLWLDASDVDVTVANGEVTLSGTVSNRDAKHHAEHLVEDLPGVIHVQNNLRTRVAGYRSTATRGFGDGVVRSEGDGAMETSANADHTTTRKS